MGTPQLVSKIVVLDANPERVWQVLTEREHLLKWMADPELKLEIDTNWKTGSPVVIKGFHHVPFENRGKVLRFEPNRLLEYNQLSSLSHLPDKPENYCVFTFELSPLNEKTLLTLTLRNFATEAIYRHVDFYWNVTLDVFKKTVGQL